MAEGLAKVTPNREPDPVLAAWQVQIHHAVEAGAPPEFAAGSSDEVLSTAVGQAALRNVVEARTDMTQPLVVMGGPTGAWLCALMQPQTGAPTPAPQWITLYSGADAATHVASSLTTPPSAQGLRPPASVAPSGLADWAAPATRPATPFNLETLALRVLSMPGALFGERSGDRWVSTLALLLVVVLIAGAILL